MRLEKIKIAGFKSFVDPTHVPMPSNLVGIVGPNGCGKSNVIDAVRWVMGESSAKMLRGESMDDVIFSGSSSRKPVGQASVELLFDNSEGKAGGKYAQYNQISVKRTASRDGQSIYSLNGVRCRRKDITDLFLGTGLGPRSYSIIEQGMISRLIEAKPEDLRGFLEEAAGISRYKERRRDTESRIARTRENLERLNDLREEITKQLQHLKRQAAAAERYKEYKTEERRVKAELLALRWHALSEDIEGRDREIAELQNTLESAVANQRKIEAGIEKDRERHAEANDHFNEIQGKYYAVGADIARLEQAIKFAEDSRRTQERDLQEVETALKEAETHNTGDQASLAAMIADLATHEPLLGSATQAKASAQETLSAAEKVMHDWQSEWDSFNQRATQPAQTAQVERTRINHLEQQDGQLTVRLDRVTKELAQVEDAGLAKEIETLGAQETERQTEVDGIQSELTRVAESIQSIRGRNAEQGRALDEAKGELQSARGRLASLEALQEVSLGKQQGAVAQWLKRFNLSDAPRLAQGLNVDDRWKRAVEVVLGHRLQGACVNSLDDLADAAATLGKGSLSLFEVGAASGQGGGDGYLLGRVKSSVPLDDFLGGIRLADSVAEALGMRGQLGAGESVITPEGVWIGRSWMRFTGEGDETAGVLARAEEIKQLQRGIESLQGRVDELIRLSEAGREELVAAERQREQCQQKFNEVNRALSDLRSRLTGMRTRVEHMRARAQNLSKEKEEIERQKAGAHEEMEQARTKLHQALEQVETLAGQREQLVARRDEARATLEVARTGLSDQRSLVQQYLLKVESLRSSRVALEQALFRIKGQVEQLSRRRESLRETLGETEAPLAEQNQALEKELGRRVEVEKELNQARVELGEIDDALRQAEQARHSAEQLVQDRRGQLDQARLGRQEVLVRGKTLEEQLRELKYVPAELYQELPPEAGESEWQEKLDKVASRIQRLGAINLAAIEEFKEQSERMEYLDAQYADVTESLETLENAMRKIDRETRTRFKETFDKVNTGMKTKFPQLFGGGHAYLELVGEDLLDAGVAVMARPPGKRNTSIHLLSGGEKALTAVALVFSIFDLNPAPFCMLDEVDAPLDDANVGRFCELVRSMSDRVQFIFITHNKVTMELSNQLMGVTMHEPGVSRVVSVDVDAAAQMAVG